DFRHSGNLRTIDERVDSMPPGRFAYTRRGLERRVLELLPNGRIGEGSASTECFWTLDEDELGQRLVLTGREEETCWLRRQEDGAWRGDWLRFEQTPVELVKLAGPPYIPQAARDARPRLLFISPVEPKDAGNGLAMRAANLLRTLVDTHRVSLLIVPLYGAGASKTLPQWISDRCEDVRWARQPAIAGETTTSIEDQRQRQEAWVDEAARCYWREHFDVIHVFRLSSLSIAAPYLDEAHHASATWRLDIDDVESRTGHRLAALYASRNLNEASGNATKTAQSAEALERLVIETWDRVYVCSERDKRFLEQRVPSRRAEIVAMPNRVSLPRHPASPPRRSPFTILYVGTLDYFPNADGAIWFCREVIPAMRELSPARFRFQIIGTGAPLSVQSLGYLPDVEVVGEVPSMDEWYERADLVVVPIRAGGGTRIKMLEALSFERPVVATSMAAEGLEVESGEHLLLADRPIPFARCCLSLMQDRALADRLARNGRSLVEERYALAPVTSANSRLLTK
ncbi:MAG: glycosyltransferase family 4 protein, partial [Nitrolancea sp.]